MTAACVVHIISYLKGHISKGLVACSRATAFLSTTEREKKCMHALPNGSNF